MSMENNFRTIRGRREIGAQVGGLMGIVSQGEVFMGPDGKLQVLPFEVIPFDDGWLVIRIGRTTYWFNDKGEYDGVETKPPDGMMSDEVYERELLTLLKRCRENRGKLPEEPYFEGPGERGKVIWRDNS